MSPDHDPLAQTNCPAIRDVLSRIGDKWSVLIVALLGQSPLRFNELRRSIDGISQRMLTLTLRNLQRDGLISRSVEPTIPPRVDYALTPLGHTLLEPVSALAAWAGQHRDEIRDARARYDEEIEERDQGSEREREELLRNTKAKFHSGL